jgi:hypothetical protein
MAAKATERRSKVPLPLFWLPSISIMNFFHPESGFVVVYEIINKLLGLFRSLRERLHEH